MLDFRQKSPHPSNETRRERRRLLTLILLMGFVVILAERASNPALWRWFDHVLSPQQDRAGASMIDNRLDGASQSRALPSDTFLLAQEHAPANRATAEAYFPGVTAADFEAVSDDTPSTRDEQTCSLRLLDILNRAKPESLGKASVGPVTYAQLFRQPSQYRGRLVTVSGIVRRASRIELFPNEYGITEYYQVWLWPSDNPVAPIVVYCLRLPKGFPTGMEIAEQAQLTGFFFKRWAYQAKDVIRIAPELLAQTLQWDKRLVMTSEEPAETWPIPLVVCVAALLALLAAWYVYLRTRPAKHALPDGPPNFDAVRAMDSSKGDADARR